MSKIYIILIGNWNTVYLQDTGKYTCQYKDSKNSDSDAETYLFATDPNRLFVANTSVATASIREYEVSTI